MGKKLKLASGLAVAATFLTAVTVTGESGAFAEDHVPTVAAVEPAVVFKTEPVVQAVPATAEREAESEPEAIETPANAASLRELVALQPHQNKLSREMQCLAGAIYFEARGESIEGQLAVGRVIVERAASRRFPNSYCGVVTQRSQFSFVRGGRIPTPRKGTGAWKRAVAIAQIADQHLWDSPAEGAMFFHARYVSPQWKLTRVAQVDNHIFYR